jgi:pimeloyl-ACP methyl ester carboxylesterase
LNKKIELRDLWIETADGSIYARAAVRHRTVRAASVVLVHGMVVSSRYMVPTAERLAPLCSVYAPDLPGYGRSAKPPRPFVLPELADALERWMSAAGLKRAHLVGNSFGCQIIAEFALRHRARVDRIVLQGPTVDPAARSVARQLLRLVRNSAREPKSLGFISLADYWAAGLRRVRATIRMALADRIEEKLARIDAPTLVVRGTRDPLVPHEWAARVAALLPRGELAELPGLPHTINYSAPDAFVEAIAPFLGLHEHAQATVRREL